MRKILASREESDDHKKATMIHLTRKSKTDLLSNKSDSSDSFSGESVLNEIDPVSLSFETELSEIDSDWPPSESEQSESESVLDEFERHFLELF
ncbi:hypothetical protein NPIL_135661 [Nephila pilipes]|uniref:Uncharacterized protein n=1 Tax=Nephila pilipes TaxID=299642 RepID=A0A8X6JLH1_NEPPI|nr:hypothetical protein NPIL_135661 [Nephila pilipes]